MLCLVPILLGACSSAAPQVREATTTPPSSSAPEATTVGPTSSATTPTTSSSTTATEEAEPKSGVAPPAWLGMRPLPLRPGEDNGVAQPTPPEMIDRQFWTTDVLDPPPGDAFVSTVTTPPPTDVLARSTWRPECPVDSSELSYATVSFYGFDGDFHTGEFILHREFAPSVVAIFEELHAQRFPIEEMVVTTQEAVDAHPTGDSNNTSSFVCRAAVNSGAWSRHAHGGAIDINPFHNPYVKGELVIPELASAYLDRSRELPGMITPDVEDLFADLGWGWGGNWSSASDWMHFSDTGG